ncbi:MAG: peptide chain release factor 2 [Pseudomonadota bacterium]
MKEQENKLKDLKVRITNLGRYLEIDSLKNELNKIEDMTAKTDFWNDQTKAELNLKKQKLIKDKLDNFNFLKNETEDLLELISLLDGSDHAFEREFDERLYILEDKLAKTELKRMLSSDLDTNSAILTLNSGAGGTEACDWVEMLLRMYLRWCEKNEFKAKIFDILEGEEAGLKNVSLTVSGEYAYGYLKAESGIHRLVRISPFDSNKRRHTSFASVHVFPDIEEDNEIDINEKDLRIDTYRAQGAGGQHVNKTDSAVRITHIPTNTVVQCQNERSQHKNKASAMKILKARLFQLEEKKKKEQQEKLSPEKKDIAWGSQIRSYVMQPYRMVKDHRTNFEKGNVDAVLDGDIDEFIEKYLLEFSS